MRAQVCKARGKDEEEADWDQEMSIFNKRISAPNQLATLRELEAKVNLGKVLFIQDSLAIIIGLNADAPLGTKLSFVTGGTGVLLWHRSDNLAFALVLGGAADISTGTGVECKIKGVLQVIDEAKGPITKKEYEAFEAPAGEGVFGHVVDFVGVEQALGGDGDSNAGGRVLGMDKTRPLINTQIGMKDREQISEALVTGVKALDALTPLGRGTSMLVIGPSGAGKSEVAEDVILGQLGTDVRCVYASTSRPLPEVRALVGRLAGAGALANTAVVVAPPDAPVGVKFATLCTAMAIGERVRDRGGHALVVADDLAAMGRVWDTLAITGLGSLGHDLARQGLIKDAAGHDLSLPAPASETELVDYEGMLVSGAVAQRRGFFSTLFMRAAKMNRSLGGGSMTSLLMVPGRPATGVTKRVDMSKYQTLSEEQKAKIQAALEKKLRDEQAAADAAAGPNDVTTELVEEYISIADGQLVLEGPPAPLGAPYHANPRLSITRIGSRAYPRALEALATQIRLNLAQAEDARKFSQVSDAQTQREDALTRRLAAALLQPAGKPAPLEEQVVSLLAVQRGYADWVQPGQVPAYLARAGPFVAAAAPGALAEVKATRLLTAAAEKAITDALADLNTLLKQEAASGKALPSGLPAASNTHASATQK